jgi:hypothetical protein
VRIDIQENSLMALDTLLNALRARKPDVRLDQLEPLVWGRIAAARAPSDVGAALGWRTGVAAMMLTIGVLVGGTAAASAAQDISPFAVHSAYAPSTLLEGRH